MFLMSASILYLVISSFLKHLAVLSGDYTYIGIMHFISLLLIGYWFYQILQFFLPMQAKNSWHQAFIGGVLVLTLGFSKPLKAPKN